MNHLHYINIALHRHKIISSGHMLSICRTFLSCAETKKTQIEHICLERLRLPFPLLISMTEKTRHDTKLVARMLRWYSSVVNPHKTQGGNRLICISGVRMVKRDWLKWWLMCLLERLCETQWSRMSTPAVLECFGRSRRPRQLNCLSRPFHRVQCHPEVQLHPRLCT